MSVGTFGKTILRIAITAVLCAVPTLAQSTFGSFVGTVKDPSGGTLADCIVTLTNTGTSAMRSSVTDASGNYSFVNVEPGTYQLRMEAAGFQPITFAAHQLLAREALRVDATMSIATAVESVNVTAALEPVITTESSSIAETKTGRELMELPIAIASRAAGSTSPISTLSTQAGVQVDNSGALSIAGSKPSMLSVTIDGISTMSVRTNAPAAELFPSFGAIAEIRVSEINNAAEFGGVSDITTVSKSGTNQWHGGVFHNSQNTALNARNPFNAAKPKIIMNNFGGYFGGPIVKDKTFFFASYEGLKLPLQQFINHSQPSLALRRGDLSVYSQTIRDPSGAIVPGKQIPLTQISPISLNALEHLFPLPNTGAPNAIANNYNTNFPTPISSHQGDIRVDQNITSKQTMFVRTTYKDRNVNDAPTGTQSVIAGPINRPERDYAVTLAHNYLLSPTVVNEVRVGVSDIRIFTSTSIDARDIIRKIGVNVPDPPGGNVTPAFNINGFQQTTTQGSNVSRSHTIQFLDNVTMTRGRHTVKIGGDARVLTAYFSNVFSADRAGRYTFNGSVTNALIGQPYAAFLYGIPDTTGLGLVNVPDSNGRSIHWAFYAQDDWKVTPKLTVNFGLRWEYHPPFLDRLSNIAVFDPEYWSFNNGTPIRGAMVVPDDGYAITHPLFMQSIAPSPVVTASQAGIPQTLHTNQKTSFAPRVGFAWRPAASGKTVIRGGYGRFIESMLGTLTSAGWAVSASNIATYTNTIVNGRPTLSMPFPFPDNLAQAGTQNIRVSADVNYRDPYVQQWNLTIEHDLGFNTGIRVSYDGSNGKNLGYAMNINQLPANTLGYAALRNSAPFPSYARIQHNTTGARSNYHALTLQANKRFSQGIQFMGTYSFSKNLSNGQGFNPTALPGQAGGIVTDPYNIDLDYGPVAFTRRHRFLSTFLYELPFGQGKRYIGTPGKALSYLVGGWQLSGVVMFQTGPFLAVVAPSADPAGVNWANFEGAGRADVVAGVPIYPENQTIRQWINPAAFSIPHNNIGRPGNSSVGSILGPGTQTISLSMFKSFLLTERVNLQFGVAASNALNHPNYAVPNLNLGTAPFGTITNVQTQEGSGPRSVQLTGRISF